MALVENKPSLKAIIIMKINITIPNKIKTD